MHPRGVKLFRQEGSSVPSSRLSTQNTPSAGERGSVPGSGCVLDDRRQGGPSSPVLSLAADQVIRQLGEGTFSKVVECVDPASRVPVAVKVVRALKKYADTAAGGVCPARDEVRPDLIWGNLVRWLGRGNIDFGRRIHFGATTPVPLSELVDLSPKP